MNKPFLSYDEQYELLKKRNMQFCDVPYAKKKLEQVGYYRLSGFWHVSRKPEASPNLSSEDHIPLTEEFMDNTYFEDIYDLYLFDKKIRVLLWDIIERLEIHLRNIIAHTMGCYSPFAYLDDNYISPKWKRGGENSRRNKWLNIVRMSITRSTEPSIVHHKTQYPPVPMPFWVSVGAWDFGTVSKYYSQLKIEYQEEISTQFNIDHPTFKNWIIQINHLRNDIAHHNRIWNKKLPGDITIPKGDGDLTKNYVEAIDFFSYCNNEKTFKLNNLLSRILVIWFLISQTSEHYTWLTKLKTILEEDFPHDLPNAKLQGLGIDDPIKLLEHYINKK